MIKVKVPENFHYIQKDCYDFVMCFSFQLFIVIIIRQHPVSLRSITKSWALGLGGLDRSA